MCHRDEKMLSKLGFEELGFGNLLLNASVREIWKAEERVWWLG